MQHGSKFLAVGIISLLLVFPMDFSTNKTEEVKSYSAVFNLSDKDKAWVEAKVAKMSLEEKCAQLVMSYASAEDTSRTSDGYKRLVRLVKELKVGGLIFFKGEINQQTELTNELQSLSEIPLLISADYERGLGMRLDDAVEFPYNMAIAAANDYKLTYLAGKYIAEEARAIGVHQNYAPMIDVNRDYRNPIVNVRAFSDDPETVVNHAIAFTQGMNEGNAISTAKHFPGHGATDLDSHYELPVISLNKNEMEEYDLLPFKRIISEGIKSIMVGHLDVKAYEENQSIPSTLSNNIINNLLLNEIKFEGLVVTDAMNMSAITKYYEQDDAIEKAINAGNDIILFPPNDEVAVKAIISSVKSGLIKEERIDFSVKKIISAKKWLGLFDDKLVDTTLISEKVNTKKHKRLASEISEKSITLLKNNKNIIPINPDNYYKTSLVLVRDTRSKNNLKKDKLIEEVLGENLNYVKTTTLSLRSRKKEYTNALKDIDKSDLIVLAYYNSLGRSLEVNNDHSEFINEILGKKKPVVFISFGNPYLINQFKDIETYLVTYGETDFSQRAMADALVGKNKIQGKLPITIPQTEFKFGDGIQLASLGVYEDYFADSVYDFSEIDNLMQEAIKDEIFPGAVLAVGHRGRLVYHKPFGKFTYDKDDQEVTKKSIFDLASVSKVIGTTSAAMFLYDEGLLELDKKVIDYLPKFNNNGKDKITVRNLLLHNSGLIAFVEYYKKFKTKEEVIDAIMNSKLKYPTGTDYVYSDLGLITLQQIIEKLAGKPLDIFLKEKLFDPIGMKRTMYNPGAEFLYDVLPTEVDDYFRMTTVKGKVHDENAYLLGGVAGHAGLFSTAEDLSKFMQMMLNGGIYRGKRYFKESTVANWTIKQTEQSSRGLGWDTKSEGASSFGNKFSLNSFGHTGFTGTSVWADKDNDVYIVLLTNRVHPTRDNRKIVRFRPILSNAIADAVLYETE